MAINIFFQRSPGFFQVISDHHWRLTKLQEVINEVPQPLETPIWSWLLVVNHGKRG